MSKTRESILQNWLDVGDVLNRCSGTPFTCHVPLAPTRRVRDAVGPSPAAARVERCVYITNPLMVRPNGSPAPATARQRGFQLPLLIKMFCNQSCGNKHMDMLNLLLG